MQQFNLWAVVAIAAVIPMITGMIWYSKAVFGKAWMRANNFRDEDMKGGKMVLILLLAYVFAFLLSIALMPIVIHQFGLYSIIDKDTTEATKTWISDSMARYGGRFRTFKHGSLHGTISGFFIAMPIIGTICLFERRSFKYAAIHVFYWVITMALMGGFICQFAKMG